ncbi:hypothetical protein Golomagni_07393 [Golovinomyces magnicellulatus]|nr:hypothetical protein Golomagni_07393 [Golovinomyces magnicellulatus]
MAPKSDVSSKMTSLSISKKSTKKKEPVADSWEDEDVSSESESEQDESGVKTPTATIPTAPPPTPMSAVHGPGSDWDNRASNNASPPPKEKRPEKTDAVARRLIAAGLGLKAPKQTEEQKDYQKSIREQEKKRREHEKEGESKRQEQKDKAKAAMWDD